MPISFADKLVDKLGETLLIGVDDKIDAISTGSLSLDVSIGVGGVPRGKITMIYGSESSGKTTLALSIVRECLKNGGTAFYVDTEGMLDYEMLVKMLGEDFGKDRFIIVSPKTAQEALIACEAACSSGEVDLVILDSVAALAPEEEQENNFEDATMAIVPRLINKFLRRNVIPTIKKNNVAFVAINQVRDNVKSSFMASLQTPGGHGLRHWSSVIIMLSKIADIAVAGSKVGINVKFSIKKNKVSAPYRSYVLPIIFGKGVDKYSDIVDFCSTMGVIKKSGAHYKFEGDTLGQGKLNAGKYLEEHQDVLDRIEKVLYNTVDRYAAKEVDGTEEISGGDDD